MKNITVIMAGLLVLGLLVSTGCGNQNLVNDGVDLTAEEENMLKYMREEEKLARDVYLYFYDMYGSQIFENISESERRHMDWVLALTNQYNMVDIAAEKKGVFINKELQKLYDKLIVKGSVSQVEALKVGATIEDVDIYDLEKYLPKTGNVNIISVFKKLNCGSRNHMRAFANQLAKNSEIYTPSYITQERYEQVLAGDHERCGRMQ